VGASIGARRERDGWVSLGEIRESDG